MNITLSGHAIRLEPPQQLLMVEAERKLDGDSVKVLHASGYEAEEGSFTLVSRSSVPSTSDDENSEGETLDLPVPLLYFAGLPVLTEVDLWSPPAQYRTIPEAVVGQFEFNQGEEYSVVILSSGSLVHATVVAR
jgi:hypothetical protein